MIPRNATHLVRGYASSRHPDVPTGALLLETWHIGEGSKDCEVAAWMIRVERGAVGRVEVTDLETHRTTIVYPPGAS